MKVNAMETRNVTVDITPKDCFLAFADYSDFETSSDQVTTPTTTKSKKRQTYQIAENDRYFPSWIPVLRTKR